MHAMRRCALFLPLGASVLAFAACGGGPPPVIVTPHYAARVSHLCLIAADQFRELHLTNTIGDYRHDATAIVHINSVFLNQLAKLNPPTELARPAAAYARAIAKSAKDQQNAVV